MADPTSDFFERLGKPGARTLRNVTGNIRIDLECGDTIDHWLLRIDNGNIAVSHQDAKADAALHTDKATFDRLARGEANAFASMLRGLVRADGDPELIAAFQGLFPAPARKEAV